MGERFSADLGGGKKKKKWTKEKDKRGAEAMTILSRTGCNKVNQATSEGSLSISVQGVRKQGNCANSMWSSATKESSPGNALYFHSSIASGYSATK